MLKPSQYFPALTGFRALAAWLVFAHHYNPIPPGFLSDLVDEGYIGVSMFFVLSGFLITIRYDNDKTSYFQYIQRRFARIYPLYFLLTTLTFIVAGGQGWTYVANITFIKGYIDELKFTGIAQAWSLTVEETFYLLAPVILFAFRRTDSFKHAVIPAPGAGIPWKAWVIILIIVTLSSLNDFILIYTFFGRAFDFFIGIVAAKLLQSGRRISFSTWIGVIGIALCIILLAFLRGDNQYGFQTIPGLVIHHLVVPVMTGFLISGLVDEHTWFRRALSSAPMGILGKSSYAFYLVHLGVIATWISGHISSNILILFILLNAVAIALYYTVERPLHQYFLPKTAGNSA